MNIPKFGTTQVQQRSQKHNKFEVRHLMFDGEAQVQSKLRTNISY